MTIFTHATVAGIIGISFNVSNESIILMIIGSFLPDIDNPNSIIGKLLFFISKPLNNFFGHRKLVHSILLWVSLYIIFVFFIPFYSFLFIGAITHIFIDCCTVKGVQLFQPFSESVAVFFSKEYRISVGSKSEFVILFLLIILLTGMFFVRSNGGFVVMFRKYIGSYEVALKHYEQTGSKICYMQGKFRHKNGLIEENKWLIIGLESGDGLALLNSEDDKLLHIPKDGFFLKVDLIKTNEQWNYIIVNKPSILKTGTCFFNFNNKWILVKNKNFIQGEILYRDKIEIE